MTFFTQRGYVSICPLCWKYSQKQINAIWLNSRMTFESAGWFRNASACGRRGWPLLPPTSDNKRNTQNTHRASLHRKNYLPRLYGIAAISKCYRASGCNEYRFASSPLWISANAFNGHTSLQYTPSKNFYIVNIEKKRIFTTIHIRFSHSTDLTHDFIRRPHLTTRFTSSFSFREAIWFRGWLNLVLSLYLHGDITLLLGLAIIH
jgi:hypothetical protein